MLLGVCQPEVVVEPRGFDGWDAAVFHSAPIFLRSYLTPVNNIFIKGKKNPVAPFSEATGSTMNYTETPTLLR